MIRKIAYIGFGDLGSQVSLFLKQAFPGEINEIYFDDNLFSTQQQNTFPFSKYTDQQFDSYDFYICLGYKNLELKTKIISEMKTSGKKLPHFIHPSAIINPTAVIGDGVIIYPGCNIDQHVILEDGVLLNNSVTVSHNSIIGKGSFLAPGVVISGNVKIGKETFIGSGTVVSNNIELGDNVITGIGTVITNTVAAGNSVIGNPMKDTHRKDKAEVKTVVLQSNYIPWKGYFDLIHDADVFIYYDEVQYTKNDWRNRNRIYTKNGLQWLSIPISADAVKLKISEVEIKDPHWQHLHYKTISLGYANAPFFHQLKPLLEETYIQQEWKKLSIVNRFLIEKIAALLGIQTTFKDSKDFILEGNRVERLINLLKQSGTTTYISGPAAKEYLEGYEDLFAESNIQIQYKDYAGYPAYTQMKEPFENYVSIVDMIANIELKEIKNYIWGWKK